MKILGRILLVALVLGLLAATAASALAAKPDDRGKPTTTTTTTTAPEGPTLFGTTCQAGDPDYQAKLDGHHYTTTADGFSFELKGRKDSLCLDVTPGGAGIWHVSIVAAPGSGTTTLNRILMVPRDSVAPGDSCGGVDFRRVALPLYQQLPHPNDSRFEVIPAPYVNACGVAFGEMVDLDLDPSTPDAPVGVAMPGFTSPLAFQVYMEAAAAGASVTVTVTLP